MYPIPTSRIFHYLILIFSFALVNIAHANDKLCRTNKQLFLLGTGGGPSIKKSRAQPANALLVNGSLYLIDTGDGIAQQLAKLDLDTKKLRAIFITHNHSDHMADYGNILLRAHASGLKHKIDTYGPAPLAKITQAYLASVDWDVQLRAVDENRPPLANLITVHEIKKEGLIYHDNNLQVTAFKVPHGAAKPAYGYRFDIRGGKSVVFSGDTSRSKNLIAYAKHADILVHEVLDPEGAKVIAQHIDPKNPKLLEHILNAHTIGREVGEVAQAAGVNTVILNHFVPSGLPQFDRPERWLNAVHQTFSDRVIVGSDLMRIDLCQYSPKSAS